MKKTLMLTALAGAVLLSGCGNKKDAYTNTYKENSPSGDYAEVNTEANGGDTAEAVNYKQSISKTIDTKMLVYTCDISIDVLEFDKSVDKIHELLNNYNGFLESEVYSDGGDTSQWKYDDSEKWKTLSAIIRVPSAVFYDFCNDIEEVGDLRRKNSSVENLNSEYSDLKTTLAIYEAKEKRYTDLLADIKNEKEAIEVENELTNIQIEIARIKTRMNNIENDVAYSYINLTVNEVREYTDKPVVKRNDTFGQRFKNTVSETWDKFLMFLEDVLFVIIRILPYLLFIGLFALIIAKIVKLISKAAEKRRKKRPAPVRSMPPQMPTQPWPPQQAPSQQMPPPPPVQGPPKPPANPNNGNNTNADSK